MRRILVGLAVIGITVAAPCFALADDQLIAEQIAKQLRAEKEQGNLKDFGIDLQVDEGIVSLTGRVSSTAQRTLALDIARGVSGVEQVVDELQVQGADATPAESASQAAELPRLDAGTAAAAMPRGGQSRSDDELARDIMSRLKAHKDEGRLKGFSLQVKPQNGQVWMIGRVASEQQQRLVLNTAAHVPGVRQVVNALRVESPEDAVGEAAAKAPSGQPGKASPQAAADRDGLLSSLLGGKPSRPAPAKTKVEGKRASAAKSAGETRRELQPATRKARTNVTLMRPTEAEQRIGTAVDKPLSVLRAGGTEPSRQVQLVGAEQAAAAPSSVPSRRAGAAPQPSYRAAANITPVPFARSQLGQTQAMPASTGVRARPVSSHAAGPHMGAGLGGAPPVPMHHAGPSFAGGPAVRYDHPSLPGYAWPSYASHPNYAAVTYPQQYSPTAWPYIGPFYPYPQVPLGWRKVTLEWDDGWWMLDFKSK